MNLPTPYTISPPTERAIAERRAALASEHIVFVDKYRIGDAVALLALCGWVQAAYGRKKFYCRHLPPSLDALMRFWDDRYPRPVILPATEAPADAKEFTADKPSLWYWQSHFKHIGFRLEFTTDKPREYDIVFAPLLDADYSTERALHPVFAYALAKWLEVTYPGRVLILSDGWCAADRERFAGLNVQTLPLTAAIEHIGSCKLFIGADTGLSHIAACFDINQLALYSKQNTAVHAARESGSMREHAEILEALTGFYGRYDAAPNQHPDRLTVLQFNYGGMDRVTLPATMSVVKEIMQ